VPIELVVSEIKRFLATKEPEVISITGRWGVGKTFAWNRYVKEAQSAKKIALKRYSYVSLFGISSLDDLKSAIFENSVKSSEIGLAPTLETLSSNVFGVLDAVGRKAARKIPAIAQQTPFLKNFGGAIAPIFFSSLKENIICIDDFERRGSSLEVREVLGLVNNLKELKNCKVCLILNEEELEEHASDYRKYLEKVVDTTLKFSPSPAECAGIALSNKSEIGAMLTDNCINLGISNIRTIKKIERYVCRLEPLVAKFDKQIMKQGAHSLTLLVWSLLEPGRAPSLEYLKKKGAIDFASISQKTPITESEAAWNALLRAYGFGAMDEFDLALLNGVQDGLFDPALITKCASELNNKITAGNIDQSFVGAWDKYHDSFDDNQEDVLDVIFETFSKAIPYITPLNLNSTVALFKTLGRTKQAEQMLNDYIERRGTEHELFDVHNFPLSAYVTDPHVIEAFKKKYASTQKGAADPRAVLLRMADTDGWNSEDISLLASLPADTYRQLFKNSTGYDLRRMIKTCLQFNNIINASSDMKEISKRAREALSHIGQESKINACRVKAYGITVDETLPD